MKKVEKTFERRKLIFHIEDRQIIAAYGQTSGGWGRIENPFAIAQTLFSAEELMQVDPPKTTS